ncbi:hypothetical protein AMK59_8416, partial [Oryctes borbonicus]
MSCTDSRRLLLTLLLALLIASAPGICGVDPEPLPTTTSTTPPTSATTTTTKSTTPPTSATTTTPTTSTTTTTSTTSTSPTTSTTPTTSTSPTTSTTPRTSTSPTTSTTPITPYTSTQLPTPTPKPPVPEKGVWTVLATEDAACIYLEMAASIEFYYINIRNEIDKGQINIPIQADVTGSCGEAGRHKQSIKLTWYFNSPFANSLEFVFRRNSHVYEIDRLVLNVTLDSEDFPLARDTNESLILLNKNIHFLTPENKSYKCNRPHTFPLHHHGNNVDIGKLKIMHLHFQAFGDITNGHVARAMDCKSHQSSWLLLILLGSIVILATVILVAYIISKRR